MIRLFNNSDGRENVVQIGGDVDCLDKPALSVDSIQDATSFPRQSQVTQCKI